MSHCSDSIGNILNTKINNNSNEIFTEFKNNTKFNSSNTLKSSKSSKNRCPQCNKKFKGLVRFKCACGIEFCATCRYPEVHYCNLDKFKNKDDLTQNMPVIAPKKIDVI